MQRTHSYAPRSIARRLTTGEHRRALERRASLPLASPSAHAVALDLVSDAVLIADRRGSIEYANPALATLLHEPADAVVGQPVNGFVTQDDFRLRDLLRQLSEQRVWRADAKITRRDGSIQAVQLTVTPAATGSGRLGRFCVLVRSSDPPATDSGPKVMQTVGRLAAEIAHDFNNHIAVVLNYTFILLRQLPAESNLRDHVRELQAAAWRASHIAQEMVSFGGQRSLDPEVLDLNAVVTSLVDVLVPALQFSVPVEIKHERSLSSVRARLPHLEWLLLELALHARVTLGQLERVLITTWNDAPVRSIESTAATRPSGHVGFTVRAIPAARTAAQRDSGLMFPQRSAFSETQFPEDASALPAAELAVTRAGGRIWTTRETDGSVSYHVRLPAPAA